MEYIASMPTTRAVATETKEVNGKSVVVRYDVLPIFSSPVLELKRLQEIATRSMPTKIATVDPNGETPYQYGRDPADLDREWEEYLRSMDANKTSYSKDHND